MILKGFPKHATRLKGESLCHLMTIIINGIIPPKTTNRPFCSHSWVLLLTLQHSLYPTKKLNNFFEDERAISCFVECVKPKMGEVYPTGVERKSEEKVAFTGGRFNPLSLTSRSPLVHFSAFLDSQLGLQK